MRHGKKFNTLGRTSAHRKQMLSNMAASLITHKRINTTVPKAKALRKYVEPLITRSKTDNTHSRRIVFKYLQDKDAVNELFRDVAQKVGDRPGGYVRIIRLGPRQGDNAEMCMIELVDYNELMLADKEDQKQKSGSGKRRRRRRGGKKKSSGQQSQQQGGQQTAGATAETAAEDQGEAQVEDREAKEASGSGGEEAQEEQKEEGQEASSKTSGSEKESSSEDEGEASASDQGSAEEGKEEGGDTSSGSSDEDEEKGDDESQKGS